MKFPHSLKFFEIADHVRRPAGLFDPDCKLGALEEFRFQLLPAHRFSGMTGRRRLDFLRHLAVFINSLCLLHTHANTSLGRPLGRRGKPRRERELTATQVLQPRLQPG